MAPNKFEKHIKKQLEEREIQPSAKAWSALNEQLNSTAQPKKKGYLWYGIAASFIGLIILSVVYFSSENPSSISDVQVVDTKDEELKETILIDSTIEKVVEVKVIETDKIKMWIENVKLVEKSQPSIVEDQITLAKEKSPIYEISPNSEDSEEELINSKLLEIVTVVDFHEQNNTALTDAEVDALLRNAQQEILNDKLFHKNGNVDAIALLSEVEVELDQSFRDKVFENLKEGFQKVRTAVVNRNN